MKKFAWMLAMVAAFAATSAWSQWYVGAGTGVATSRVGGSTGGLSFTARDNHNVGLKLLGGYQFTPNLGLEAQYADLGRFGYNACAGVTCGSGRVHASQWSLAATGTMPLANHYFLMAKLGASQNQVRAGQFCAGATCADLGRGTRTDLLAGVGVGYQFSRNIAMRFEYEHFGKLFSTNGLSARGDHWAASLLYSF